MVYEIKCKDCEKTYIEETAINAGVKAKEHFSHARNGRLDQSAVAEHAWTVHKIDWAPTVIAINERNRERKIKESLLLKGREKAGKALMNRDEEWSTCRLDLLW